MVPWKDMSDPGKAWQDKKVFPDVLFQIKTPDDVVGSVVVIGECSADLGL